MVCMPYTAQHLCMWNVRAFTNVDIKHNFTGSWAFSWLQADSIISKLKEFFCDRPCYNLIGCGNVGLFAALNGRLPPLADWAAKTACFLFLSLSVMCAVAEPVIELWKLAIFVFQCQCEMWSELCARVRESEWGKERVGEGGHDLEYLSFNNHITVLMIKACNLFVPYIYPKPFASP